MLSQIADCLPVMHTDDVLLGLLLARHVPGLASWASMSGAAHKEPSNI